MTRGRRGDSERRTAPSRRSQEELIAAMRDDFESHIVCWLQYRPKRLPATTMAVVERDRMMPFTNRDRRTGH